MQNFQDTFEVRKRSFISDFSMNVPLNKASCSWENLLSKGFRVFQKHFLFKKMWGEHQKLKLIKDTLKAFGDFKNMQKNV